MAVLVERPSIGKTKYYLLSSGIFFSVIWFWCHINPRAPLLLSGTDVKA